MKLFSLKNIPLTIVIAFNLFTLLIFFTAPLNWKTNNLLTFFFFSTLCQIMIMIGFRMGYKTYSKKKISNPIFHTLTARQFNFIFFFYMLTFLVRYAYLLRFGLFDIQGMFDFLLIGLADQHIGYQLAIDASRSYTLSWSLYFFTSIINQMFFLTCFLKWKDMNRFKKYFFIAFVSIEIFYWFGRGTNFGIISIITTLVFAAMHKMRNARLNFKKIILMVTLLIFLLIGSISIFSVIMGNRRGNADLDYQQFELGRTSINENAIAFSFVPKPLHDTYMYVVSYLAQGYYHTCLAFDLDFRTSYGLGNNPALSDFAKVFHLEVWETTYMYRLRLKGVDPLVNWHSAYTWFASDISFFGVPFLLLGIGFFFGISWTLSVNRNDFLSKIVFVVLGNMLLYLFANNTYLSSIFYSFLFILPIWYFTRVKRFKKIS